MQNLKKIVLLTYIFMMAVYCGSIAAEQEANTTAANNTIGELSTASSSEISLTTCASCHGENGISQNTDWPNLAGQKAEYLYQQLVSYRNGTRRNEIMTAAIVANFSDTDLRSIAYQYANMPSVAKSNSDINKLPGAHVRARCVSCHGMNGKTVTDLWPNIAGQQAGYLESQLTAYKNGSRKHPIMEVIANELTQKQIKDVAQYYSKH